MFHSLPSLVLFALVASSVVTSSPVAMRQYGEPAPMTPRALLPVTLGGIQIGFNDQGGNFDDFFGVGNFAGNLNPIRIIPQPQQRVCRQIDLIRVQQGLAVVQEFVKQIILQQVCQVEIQAVLIEQFISQFLNFGRNVRRVNGGIAPSFDIIIAQKISQLIQFVNQGGNLADLNLEFLGSDIGRNGVQIGGSNWNDTTSPGSVGNAYKVAKEQQKKEKERQDAAKSTSSATSIASGSATPSAPSTVSTGRVTTSPVPSATESISIAPTTSAK